MLWVLAIADDGNHLMASEWDGFVHYHVCPGSTEGRSEVKSTYIGGQAHWVNMDSTVHWPVLE